MRLSIASVRLSTVFAVERLNSNFMLTTHRSFCSNKLVPTCPSHVVPLRSVFYICKTKCIGVGTWKGNPLSFSFIHPSPLLSQQIITLEIPNGFQNVIKHEINKKDETMIIKKGKKNRHSIFKDSKISYELSETYMH